MTLTKLAITDPKEACAYNHGARVTHVLKYETDTGFRVVRLCSKCAEQYGGEPDTTPQPDKPGYILRTVK